MPVQRSEFTTTGRNQGPRRTSSVGDAPWSASSAKAASSREAEGTAMASGDRIHSGRQERGIEIQHRSQPRYHYESGRGTPSAVLARGNPIKLEAAPETEAGHGERMNKRRSRNSGDGAAQKGASYLHDISAGSVRAASSRAVRETAMASGDRIQSARRERGIRGQQMPQPWNRDGGERGLSSAISTRRNPVKLEAAAEAEDGRGQRMNGRGSRNNVGAARNGAPFPSNSSAGSVKTTSSRIVERTDMASGDRIHSARPERGTRSQKTPRPSNRDGGERGASSTPLARRNPVKVEAAAEAEESHGHSTIYGRGSRRKAPLKAPRYESTLFDHLLKSNIKFEITPEQQISGDEPDPDAGDGNGMRRTSASALDDFPLKAGTITILSSTTTSPPAADGSGRGTDGAVGRALAKGKCAKPRLTTQGCSQRRVAGNNEVIRKPGKQRIGPRKKSLSVLKKRILLHRAEQWGHQMSSTSSEVKRTNGSFSAAPNGQQWVVNIRNLVEREDVEDEEERAEIECDLEQMASEFGVVVRVEVPQATALLGKSREEPVLVAVVFSNAEEAERARKEFHGIVVGGSTLEAEIAAGECVERLDNNADAVFSGDGGGTGAVDTANEFATKDAKVFQDCFPASAAGSGAPCCPNPSLAKGLRFSGSIDGNKDTSAHRWLVAVKNVIDVEDNLEDDEEYAEICADAAQIVGACSHPISVDIPRPNGEDEPSAVRDIIATFASREEAERCVAEMCGRCIGGKELFAELIVDPPKDCSKAQGEANVGSIGEAAFANGWRVVVKNLIDQEDLVEDEDYAEVRSDVVAMASEYGRLSALCIPRTERELGAEVGEAVAVFVSPEEARACARGLGSRTVGGKRLEVVVLSSPWVKGGQNLEGDSGISQGGLRPKHGEAFAPNAARQSEQKSPAGATRAEHNGSVAPLPPGKGANESGGGGNPSRRFDGEGESAKAVADALVKKSMSMAGLSTSRQEKRLPDKYKEIIGLPRHPASNGWKPKAYVTQVPDPEIDSLVFKMLQTLFTFQERARLVEPLKAKAKQRLVMGLREVLRGVKAGKVRLLILAPNVDAMGGKGGLDDKMTEIVAAAEEKGMPLVFALSMRKIGKALGKAIKVSVVGIYSFDGANEQHKELFQRLEAIRRASTVLAMANDSNSISDEPLANSVRMDGDGHPA